MTDKYEEALADIRKHDPCTPGWTEAVYNHFPTIRHALANCLPELKDGWRYDNVMQSDEGWVVKLGGPSDGLTRRITVTVGETPRAACIEAIKNIGGGE